MVNLTSVRVTAGCATQFRTSFEGSVTTYTGPSCEGKEEIGTEGAGGASQARRQRRGSGYLAVVRSADCALRKQPRVPDGNGRAGRPGRHRHTADSPMRVLSSGLKQSPKARAQPIDSAVILVVRAMRRA